MMGVGRGLGRGSAPPQKILGLFHLKWLILVQILLYIFTEMLGYLPLGGPRSYCILLAADGVLLLWIVPGTVSESLNGWSEALTLTVGLGV